VIPHARLFVLPVCLFLLSSSPALAQYIYLDSNGDGIHTAADAVNPAGPTTMDIWLNTTANRDGTPTVCAVAPEQPLSIFGYTIDLHATGGTISWGTMLNRLPNPAIRFAHGSTATDFGDGYGLSSPFLPPGLYRLATLTISVASGTPAIDFVNEISLTSDVNTFGSACYASDFDNTMTLGRDWFDADGLPFGTGGSPNQPPILANLSGMTLATGELAYQDVHATDADHQPLTFSKQSGPAFMTVATRDVGGGTASGIVALAPHAGDEGDFTGTVSVSDGLAAAQSSFSIHVNPGPNHPPSIGSPDAVRLVIGTTPQFSLTAVDPDGQGIAFQKIEGPNFMTVHTLDSGAGGSRGELRFNPELCDAGAFNGVLGATDGVTTESKSLAIQVVVKRAAPNQPPRADAASAIAIATGDIDGDGHADLVTGGTNGTVSVLLGRGDGTFAAPINQQLSPAGGATSVALGDWNGDGRLDAAVASSGLGGNGVFVLIGTGSGGFSSVQGHPSGSLGWTIRPADLDGDGDLDLAISEEPGFRTLINHGDGTFEAGPSYSMGLASRGFVLEDFNRDGRLDAVTANLASDDVVIRFGLGQALFSDPKTIDSIDQPFVLVSRDWDHDGDLDLAVGTFDNGKLRVYNGDGAGHFALGAQLTVNVEDTSLDSSDLDGDGDDDLIVSGATPLQAAYSNGDGTFQPSRLLSRTATGRFAIADYNEDGFPDVAAAEGWVQPWLNDAGGAGMPEARAFAESNAPAGGKPTTCMRLEPVAASFRSQDVDLGSITLSPENGGGSIQAVTTKTAVISDTDGNGISEVPACFSKSDLAGLFPAENGRQTVSAHLEGALVDGRRFCSSVSFDVIGTGKKLTASLTPNPLNPSGILRLTTSRDGFVRVRMFDLQGRVVRVLEDRAMVPAGAHDVRIDGRNTAGQTLASGVYFYEVETSEGSLKGRITVLK